MPNSSGITYKATLPLSWQIAEPDESMIMAARFANLELLHALSVLETATEKDHDPDSMASKAIDRLEAKLDITIGLLSRLVAQHSEMPSRVPVTLGIHKIEWRPDTPPPEIGARIKLFLHLSPRLPDALQLYARVTQTQLESCVAEFLDQDAELEEWITRTLFRYHRRALQARHQI